MGDNNLNNMTNTNEVVDNNVNINAQNNKNDKWKNVLIVILIIISLFLTALTIYVVLDKKRDNIDNNKDNVQEENKNNSNVDNNEKDYTELEQKVLDEYYLKTTDIINEHILQWKYSAIADGKISYNDFRKNYVVKNVVASLKPISNTTNEYDVKEVKDKFLDIYNDMFNSSFEIYLSNEIYGAGYSYSYDKNIDKIIKGGHGGTAGFDERVIFESKEENNLYKVTFVEGHFSPGGRWMSLDIDSNQDISNDSEASEVVKRNKDKLPNYEIVFEKTSTGYKYKSIRKIENKEENKNYEQKFSKIDETKDLYYVIEGNEYDIYMKGDWESIQTIFFDYPVININTNSVKELNKNIKETYESIKKSIDNYEVTHQEIPTDVSCSTCLKLKDGYHCDRGIPGITYEIKKDNDLLKLSLSTNSYSICGYGGESVDKYIISLVYGNVLTEEDIFNYLNYDKNDMLNKLRDYLSSEYEVDAEFINDILNNLKFDINNNKLLMSWNLGTSTRPGFGNLIYNGSKFEEVELN